MTKTTQMSFLTNVALNLVELTLPWVTLNKMYLPDHVFESAGKRRSWSRSICSLLYNICDRDRLIDPPKPDLLVLAKHGLL
ncbi:hypothetical protein TNCV_4263131 [Trichonephila clavipes]|nr:hypothetical protein TNCV_4263131 [Trichonephila clavipes]